MFSWPIYPAVTLSVTFTDPSPVYSDTGDYPSLPLVMAYAKVNPASVPQSELVTEPAITWAIELVIDNSTDYRVAAYFEYYLAKTSVSNPGVLHTRAFYDSNVLNRDKPDTSRIRFAEPHQTYSEIVEVSDTIDTDSAIYGLRLLTKVHYSGMGAGLQVGSINDSKYVYNTYVASKVKLASFILDYLPISIVYCPPGQDMSASLKQGVAFATAMTIGGSHTVGQNGSATSGMNVGFRANETKDDEGKDVPVGGSISASNVSTSGTGSQATSQTSSGLWYQNFRNTIITADNKTAIGRAYWGPLGDVFVIGKRTKFNGQYVSETQTLFYAFDNMEKILVAPVHRLLRPSDHDEINTVPPWIRRQLLALDPFVRRDKLHAFIPDEGSPDLSIPLSDAIDSTAFPTENNRAELIGRWYPSVGTDIQYSLEDAIELTQEEANQLDWSTSGEHSFGGGIGLSIFGFSVGASGETTKGNFDQISYQSSFETRITRSYSAACHLIRNQNATDLRGIEIYYDKIFSTLMFRIIPDGPIIIQGVAIGVLGDYMDRIQVELIFEELPEEGLPPHPINELPKSYKTTATTEGRFEYRGMYPGTYLLKIGDQAIRIDAKLSKGSKERVIDLNVSKVKRPIDLQNSPVWEVKRSLRLNTETLNQIRTNLGRIMDEDDLLHLMKITKKDFQRLATAVKLTLPRTPLYRLKGINPKQIDSLRQAGIASVQDLWAQIKKERKQAKISKITKIKSEIITQWADSIDLNRVSKSTD